MSGRLIGIARRDAKRAPMETLERGVITVEGGLEGDFRGPKLAARRITVLSREAWEAALGDLPPAGAGLAWTTRRANLLVEDVRLPRAAGGVLRVGAVVLEITDQTSPCRRMEEAFPGLLKALSPDSRGGVLCRVREGGDVALGDDVEVIHAPAEHVRALPG